MTRRRRSLRAWTCRTIGSRLSRGLGDDGGFLDVSLRFDAWQRLLFGGLEGGDGRRRRHEDLSNLHLRPANEEPRSESHCHRR